jgi:nucleoside 2-deoxyribosyltransferase
LFLIFLNELIYKHSFYETIEEIANELLHSNAFSPEFDDVYAVIKQTVESSTNTNNGRCFRRDETRQAGRITDRLLSELRAAIFCVADIAGNKPNVMWEIGFAMALAKPIIIVTQNQIRGCRHSFERSSAA